MLMYRNASENMTYEHRDVLDAVLWRQAFTNSYASLKIVHDIPWGPNQLELKVVVSGGEL